VEIVELAIGRTAGSADERVCARRERPGRQRTVACPVRRARTTPDAEDWYTNLLLSGRRKCLLLTHAATLFSVFEADVSAVDLRATHRLVTELVDRELRREGLPPATFGNLRSQELILAKTADRSVLGCMNDMAFLCEVAISDAGGLAHFDLGELNHTLHRNINSSRGYRPRLSSPHNSLSAGNQPDKKQARSRRHPANSALGSPAEPTSRPWLNTIHPSTP
jgi:hypothetical protein